MTCLMEEVGGEHREIKALNLFTSIGDHARVEDVIRADDDMLLGWTLV